MKRLILLSFGTMLLLSIGVAAVRAAAFTQPVPMASVFADPTGRPCAQRCLFGVIPGETTFEQAMQMLDEHPLTRGRAELSLSNHVVTYRINNFEVQLGQDTGDLKKLSMINVRSLDPGNPSAKDVLGSASFGELFTSLGSPEYVNASIEASIFLYYPADHLQIGVIHAENQPEFPISEQSEVFLIQLVAANSYQNTLESIGPSLKGWRGLTSVRRYMNMPSQYLVPN